MEVLPLTGGARPPMDVLAERLRAGRAICLVADRDLSRNGIDVQFFGETTRMPGGPAHARRAHRGAACCRSGCGSPPTAGVSGSTRPSTCPAAGCASRSQAGTQAMADVFAREIAAHPADWHMLQRLWLADLPPRRERTDAEPAPAR